MAVSLLVLAALSIMRADDASAGWNAILGAMLFGVVAAGDRRAPTVAVVVSAIMLVRVVVALWLGHPFEAGLGSLLLLAVALAAQDLKKQARAVPATPAPDL